LRGCGYKTASGLPRWLNRDPIGEYGGINLYQFCINALNQRVDLFGLLSPADHPVPGGPSIFPDALNALCNAEKGLAVVITLALYGWDPQDPSANAVRHCMASCLGAKLCGLEGARKFWQGREKGDDAESRRDMKNNEVGFSLCKKKSCEDACFEALENGQLYISNSGL